MNAIIWQSTADYNSLYPGVVEGLETLQERGITTGLRDQQADSPLLCRC